MYVYTYTVWPEWGLTCIHMHSCTYAHTYIYICIRIYCVA